MANPPKYVKPVDLKTKTVSPAASKFANRAVKNVMTNKLVPGANPGSRGAAATPITYRTKPKGNGAPKPNNAYGVTYNSATPTAPDLSSPDVTDTNYGEMGNLMDNTQIAGLAGKIQLPNASKYANAMSNLQYGGQIQALTGRIKGLTDALPGSLQALDAAFKNIDAQRVQTITNPQTSGQGVANLFGGSTSAAGVAANQSAQASATSANQAGSLSDQGAANQRREADWATRIQLLNNMAVNQSKSDLIGAQGERDQAKKGYYDQALKTRGDMVSQAISNQGAINNQRISSALAQSSLDQAGVKTTAGKLANAASRVNLQALPTLLQTQIQTGKMGLITSQLTNNITAKTAQAQLKQLKVNNAPVKQLNQAIAKGGDGALAGMILPTGAVAQDPNTGAVILRGDPNVYYRNGVNAIMLALPGSSRKKVKQYVANKVSQAVAEAGWGNYKNGRWVKVGK